MLVFTVLLSWLVESAHAINMPLYSMVKGAKCSFGYEPVTSTWQDCKTAATWLGMTGDSIAHVDYVYPWGTTVPQGCFRGGSGGNLGVNFNTGKGGNARRDDHIICRLVKGGVGWNALMCVAVFTVMTTVIVTQHGHHHCYDSGYSYWKESWLGSLVIMVTTLCLTASCTFSRLSSLACSYCSHVCDSAGAKPMWLEVVPKAQCDTSAGEVSQQSSPGKVSNIAQCKKSCEDAKGCRSVTYFNSGWCGHFSTACTRTKSNSKAVAVVLSYQDPQETTPKLKAGICPMEGGYCVKVNAPTSKSMSRALTTAAHALSHSPTEPTRITA